MPQPRYRVTLSPSTWLEGNVLCQEACPVHTDSGGYAASLARSDVEGGYRIARRPNPFASVCGRICAHPCEEACRRGRIDQPVALRALKRSLTERCGVESDWGPRRAHEAVGWRPGRGMPAGAAVAVVGAGPAGLACAHDLALAGHRVTVFEAARWPGGMFRLGIPEYRLPREVIDKEIQAIEAMGVEIRCGLRLGVDLALDGLLKDYAALFLAVGAHRGRDLALEGAHLDGLLRAVEFLLNLNLGYHVELGDRVVVVGGGNVAIDVARTVARIVNMPRTTTMENLLDAIDVARSALRLGVKDVRMICLESWEEMPADGIEIAEAVREGIRILPRRGPKRFLGKGGRVTAVETLRVERVFDEAGRFSPTFLPATEEVLEADTVILAVGQAPDLSFLSPHHGIAVTPRGTIAVDPETLATTRPGVYAGGDVAFGPRNAIDAVAEGRWAARSIQAYLGSPRARHRVVHREWVSRRGWERERDYDRLPRQEPPTLPVGRRMGLREVELPYSEEVARREGRRCLQCHLNVVVDATRCVLCGRCAEVCPYRCIRMVGWDRLGWDSELVGAMAPFQGGEGGPGTKEGQPGSEGYALILEEARCVRCGLCLLSCPSGCIAFLRVGVREEEAHD